MRQHTYVPRRTAARLATAFGLSVLTGLGGVVWAPPASADGQCTFPGKEFKGTPWSLQRVLLEELWKDTKGKGIRVAVIDSGVDVKHPQLKTAVDTRRGRVFLPPKLEKDALGNEAERGKANGTTDNAGHGTKVAGIIAARPMKTTGFVGIAPEATIIPLKQNDANGSGKLPHLVRAIDYAVDAGADVINISQDTTTPLDKDSSLEGAVNAAIRAGVVVVASAGNDGLDGKSKHTYPASYPGVLAVAASDRNNERAAFSQSGDFVGIAAPGVDMVSTVPRGGYCADNGTSFAAPYVTGVVALLRAKYPEWKPHQIIAQLQQTAERSTRGHDQHVGWGVVDPVRALNESDGKPIEAPKPEVLEQAEPPTPARLDLGETPQERNERLGTYALLGGGVLATVIAGGSLVYRDWRRRTGREAGQS